MIWLLCLFGVLLFSRFFLLSSHESFANPESQGIPKGTIVAWTGRDPPNGWVLCDGRNGTPDLRGRFLLGSDDKDYQIGATGGEEEHTLTLKEMPKHRHTIPTGNRNKQWGLRHSGRGNMGAPHRRRTDSQGEGQPHNNMPPYYAVAWIMKNVEDSTDPTQQIDSFQQQMDQTLDRIQKMEQDLKTVGEQQQRKFDAIETTVEQVNAFLQSQV